MMYALLYASPSIPDSTDHNPPRPASENTVLHTVCWKGILSSFHLQSTGALSVFSSWCRDRGLDPVSCTLQDILQYLQYIFEADQAASTINVHVAAIPSPVCAQYWVVQFLWDTRRIYTPAYRVPQHGTCNWSCRP